MEKITGDLFALQDVKYRDFHAKLIPQVDKERVIGVRTPVLRKYAKELAKRPESDEFLKELPHHYYEENNLHGDLLNAKVKDLDRMFEELERFLPYVDNWATCDLLSPKLFRKDPVRVLERIKIWLGSSDVYVVRFGIVSLLGFYLDQNYQKEVLELVAGVQSQEYYINMAIAWFFSIALMKHYEDAIEYLTQRRLPQWVHNKTIQKAVESYRIPPEIKDYLRGLRWK